MNQILCDTGLWFYTIKQNIMNAIGYNLFVVEEEAVPLVAGDMISENNMLPFALCGMGMLVLITICTMYWLKCRQYRLRIQRLNRGKEEMPVGWNVKRLKETVRELEWKMAGK